MGNSAQDKASIPSDLTPLSLKDLLKKKQNYSRLVLTHRNMKGKKLYPINFEVRVVISAQSSVHSLHLRQLPSDSDVGAQGRRGMEGWGWGGVAGEIRFPWCLSAPPTPSFPGGPVTLDTALLSSDSSGPFPVSPGTLCPLYAESALMPADI